MSFQSLEQAHLTASTCVDCKLSKGRQKVVFARGNQQAKLMVIGDFPGAVDEQSGEPFRGTTGALLDKILQAGNIDPKNDVYICNVLKCHPHAGYVVDSKEIAFCRKYLDAQIQFVSPKLLILAGSHAVQTILQVKYPISQIRGKWFPWANDARVMPVFHPSYLLRNESKEVGSPKWLMWQDIKEVRKQLDLILK
jgi:uracil-DNA glycosylase family 4